MTRRRRTPDTKPKKKPKLNSGKFDYTGEDVIKKIQKQTDTVMLAFSGGKDSIATWLGIHGKFKRIIPVFRYPIPDLDFVEASIKYYEEFFQTPVIRVPHPSFYRWLAYGLYQPPGRQKVIDGVLHGQLPGYEEMNDWIRDDLDLGDEVYIASGVRAFDSVTRYMFFKRHGAINHNNKAFYPIFDWKKDRMIDEFNKAGLKLPVDYEMFGRSFDGLDLSYVYHIKKWFPYDYERIKFWFPLVDVEFMRYGEEI